MGYSDAVVSPQRKMKILDLRVDGTGTAALAGSCANFCTLTDNDTGDYTIAFTDVPFDQIPTIVASPIATDVAVRIASRSITGCNILTEKISDGSAVDADFDMIVVGSNARDLIG